MKSGLLRQYSPTFVIVLRLLDLLLVWLCGYVVYVVKFDDYWFVGHYFYLWFTTGLASLLVLHLSQAYEPLRGKRFFLLVRQVWVALSCLFLIVVVCFFLFKVSVHYSRQWLLSWYVLSLVGLVLMRWVVYRILYWLRQQDFNVRRVVIVGADVLGMQVAQQLSENNWSGYKVVAFWAEQSTSAQSAIPIEPYPQNMVDYIEQHAIDEVWVTLPLSEAKTIKVLVDHLAHSPVNIRVVPDLFGMQLLNHSISDIAGVCTINLRATPMHGVAYWVKEIEDKLLASVIILCLSPLLLALAIAVKLSSPGPIFYRQERVSWNNKKFMMLKFRSMPVGTEQKTGAVWAKKGENRATKIGAFMRRTSLDELPQFFNVLKGDMSIVGPRPERPVFVEKFKEEIPGYMQKHMMKAGITGWAQVHGWRGDTDLKKRVEYDLYYIEHWSLWLDLKIIMLTFWKGLINKNAY